MNINLHRKEGPCKFDSFAHVTISASLGIRSNVYLFSFPSIFSSSFVTPSVGLFVNIFCLNDGTFETFLCALQQILNLLIMKSNVMVQNNLCILDRNWLRGGDRSHR